MIWLYALRDYARENKLNAALRQALTEWCASVYVREATKDLSAESIMSISPWQYSPYIASLNLKSDYQLIQEFLKVTEFDKYPAKLDDVARDIIKDCCSPIEMTKIAKYGK